MSGELSDDFIRDAIKDIIVRYDTDKSGTISKDEIKPLVDDVCEALGLNKHSSEEIDEHFREFDKNGDKVINSEELLGFIKFMINDTC